MWSMTKVMDVSVRQLSNAYLPSCAPGARTLLSSDPNSTKGAALRKHFSAVLDTPRGGHLSQHVAPLEGPIFKTYDRGWELDNLQLLTTLPGRESYMLNAHCHFYVPEHGCSIEGSVSNFSARVGRDAYSLGVAFSTVSLELPDGVSIYHAGTYYDL